MTAGIISLSGGSTILCVAVFTTDYSYAGQGLRMSTRQSVDLCDV